MDPLTQLQTALSDPYRVQRQIGVGGMATVFLARDLRHERNVAQAPHGSCGALVRSGLEEGRG